MFLLIKSTFCSLPFETLELLLFFCVLLEIYLSAMQHSVPMFVAFSFTSGYKRFSSAMENKPYPRFYGCPHCFRRKTKQYSVRLNVCLILQFICPLFSGISRNLIYVNDYFTILYIKAIFLKHTFSSRLI